MVLWHVHRDLAYSLGDPVMATEINIPDGVRFSKSMRDGYIYRAMMKIYDVVLRESAPMDKITKTKLIKLSFPQSIVYETIAIELPELYVDLEYKALSILHATTTILGYTSPDNNIPVVINDEPLWYNALTNAQSIQRPVPYANYYVHEGTGRIQLIDREAQLTTGAELNIAYLPEPEHPEDLDETDELMIDNIYINQLIKSATLYGRIDSQDLEDASLYEPNL